MFNVKFHCNYCSDLEIYNRVLGMSPGNLGVWKNLKVVNDDNYDVFVIMNYPQHSNYDPKKTIVFESETPTTRNQFPKFYQDRRFEFLYIHDTKNHFNVDLWYHGLTYDELTTTQFKKTKSFSVVNSNLNNLPGHVYRNNFIKTLSENVDVDMYGRFPTSNKNYKGSLNRKADGLIDYHYTFNCENDFESNYFTEKILDGIFCECVTFYVGCPNIKQFVNENSFISLSLSDVDMNIDIIKECLKTNIWDYMFDDIREEKRRIISDFNVLNIVNDILERI